MRNADIQSISCVNLRSDNGVVRTPSSKLAFQCTLCKKKQVLGKESSSVVRISCEGGEEVLCSRCLDLFVEVCVYGSSVFIHAREWRLSSRTLGVTSMQEEMMCFKCSRKRPSHIHIKYVDILGPRRVGRYLPLHYVRMCGECLTGVLAWMRHVEITDDEYAFEPRSEGEVLHVPVRRWAT